MTGNRPQRSVYIVLIVMSPRTVKQYMQSSSAVHNCCGGFRSSTACRASRMSYRLCLVDCTPLRWRIMWPLSVAVYGGRCLLINWQVKPGKELHCLLEIAQRNDDFCVGLYEFVSVSPKLKKSRCHEGIHIQFDANHEYGGIGQIPSSKCVLPAKIIIPPRNLQQAIQVLPRLDLPID